MAVRTHIHPLIPMHLANARSRLHRRQHLPSKERFRWMHELLTLPTPQRLYCYDHAFHDTPLPTKRHVVPCSPTRDRTHQHALVVAYRRPPQASYGIRRAVEHDSSYFHASFASSSSHVPSTRDSWNVTPWVSASCQKDLSRNSSRSPASSMISSGSRGSAPNSPTPRLTMGRLPRILEVASCRRASRSPDESPCR